ncbi:hypothetical protein GCM10023092_08800 [Rurimicrobium arvi]|uniref:SbsA Ig-like domain-containing protein n=2 Tax=Rurimicrobium arvi TaxID=2049916 RepID=A0ABP8MM75_9BACT
MIFLCLQQFAQAQESFRLGGSIQQPEICISRGGPLLPGEGLFLMIGKESASLPVQCRFETGGQGLCFTPVYPLAQGAHFLLHVGGYADTILSMPELRTPSAGRSSIGAVYPLSDTIPENILFFHVAFTQRMTEDREAWKKVAVRDANGNLIPRTWRQRSFWLDSGRLLVLMIHPGRVKSGIHYTGPVFTEGHRYEICVDSSLTDISGNYLSASFRKIYYAGAEQRQVLLYAANLQQLRRETRDTLVLQFSQGLDHAAAVTNIMVTNDQNASIPVVITQPADREIRLLPVDRWPEGELSLVLGADIYDYTGNRLNRSFEVSDSKDMLQDKNIHVLRAHIK